MSSFQEELEKNTLYRLLLLKLLKGKPTRIDYVSAYRSGRSSHSIYVPKIIARHKLVARITLMLDDNTPALIVVPYDYLAELLDREDKECLEVCMERCGEENIVCVDSCTKICKAPEPEYKELDGS